jgi:hypothetical protein
MDDHMLGNIKLGPVVAVQWCDDMAARFPDADHHGCRQSMRPVGARWMPFDPPLCHGYHCPHCGAPTGQYGHRRCA